MMAHARRLGVMLAGAALPALCIAALEVAARSGYLNPVFAPPPSAITSTLAELVTSGRFLEPLLHTLMLFVAGFSSGCAVAIALGLLMGSSRIVFNLFEPLTEMLRPIPKPALLPALMLLLGMGPRMEITTVALGVFFPVLINTVQGVRSVDPVMVDVARTFGHGRAAVWWRILLPASAQFILAGMRVALGIGFVLVVLAEMLAANGGLGDVILTAQRAFLVRDSFAWLVIVALVGFVLTALFNAVERRLVSRHAAPVQ
jgi:ABC-type nitrate/sulfonate/bicarbonate transport system permease component